MPFFTIFVGVLVAIVALLLILVVLFQNPKDSGGNLLAGNSEMKQLVGIAEMPHILYKVTYWLLSSLFVLTMIFAMLLKKHYDTIEDAMDNFLSA